MAIKFDSIGLAGVAVGVVEFTDDFVNWSSRNGSDLKNFSLESVLRASWAQIGKLCHLRLFAKTGERHRFDGFRRSDIDTLRNFFESKDIEFENESVASGGGNYGNLEFEDGAGIMSLTTRDKSGSTQGLFEINIGSVTQCVTPGHKQDELDIQFTDVDTGSREDQALSSMRLWVPGQQAAELQTRILAHAAERSQTGDILVAFDREMGNFVAPKNKYSIEMYQEHFRMHGSTYDFKIAYKDISRFYMLERPRRGDAQSWYFVICLDKMVRQGQQKYPYLVWQTHNEEATLDMNLEEDAIEERFPGAGLKPTMEGALHKLIAKVFKVLSGKTVFSASKKYLSSDESKCISCNLGQRSGVLYPMDKSFLFLVQPVLVVEYSEVEYVEFKKEPNTRNFEFLMQLKRSGSDGAGKKYQFGSIEKKEFRPLVEFMRLKDALFQVRNDGQEEEEAGEDGEDDSEEDEDFNSEDEAAEDNVSSSSDSDDSENDDDSEREGGGGGGGMSRTEPTKVKARRSPEGDSESQRKTKRQEPRSSTKKKAKKDPAAPKQAKSAYFFFVDEKRETIKAENPEASFGELGKLMGAKWKSLSDEEKAPYNEKAAVAKEEYKEALAAYVPPPAMSDDEVGAEEPNEKKRKGKVKKDPNAPKKPMTAYFIFMGQERDAIKAEHPEASIGELGKLMGAKWKSLSDEEKAPFNEKAAVAKEEYKLALAKYTATAGGSVEANSEDDDLDNTVTKKIKAEEEDED